MASSRVGQRISTCGARTAGSTRSMPGIAKAAVLPEPVCDMPHDVGAAEQSGYGLGLNRRGFLETHLLDSLENLRRKPELGEKFLLHQGRTLLAVALAHHLQMYPWICL